MIDYERALISITHFSAVKSYWNRISSTSSWLPRGSLRSQCLPCLPCCRISTVGPVVQGFPRTQCKLPGGAVISRWGFQSAWWFPPSPSSSPRLNPAADRTPMWFERNPRNPHYSSSYSPAALLALLAFPRKGRWAVAVWRSSSWAFSSLGTIATRTSVLPSTWREDPAWLL